MPETIVGRLEITDPKNNVRIRLTGSGAMSAGGHGESGSLLLTNEDGKTIGLLGAVLSLMGGTPEKGGTLMVNDSNGKTRLSFKGDQGSLELSNQKNEVRIKLTGSGDITAGGNGGDGTLLMTNSEGKTVGLFGAPLRLMGGSAALGGMLLINGSDGKTRLSFNSSDSEFTIGEILRFLDGTLRLGDGGKNGKLMLRNAAGSVVVSFDAANGEGKIGQSFDYLNGVLTLGAFGNDSEIVMKNGAGAKTVSIDGKAGDIEITNADCAEDFDLLSGEEAVPGAVMVLADDGSVRQSQKEYDSAVAGVVSGAGSYRPGIVMDRHESDRARVPLAMMGKVFCLVDADFGVVRPGSLLTTSPRRGHAMLASEPSRAFGAVLGKALKPCESGQGLIPVMVALQ